MWTATGRKEQRTEVCVVDGRVQVRGALEALHSEGQIVLVAVPKGRDVARQPHAAGVRGFDGDVILGSAVAEDRDVGGQRGGPAGGHRSGGLCGGRVGRDVALALLGCDRVERHQRACRAVLRASIPAAHILG